jgi:hypothetical protein
MAHHVARHCGAPLSHLSDLADVQPAEVPERRERVLVGDRYLVDILSSGRCGRGARTRELLHRRLKQYAPLPDDDDAAVAELTRRIQQRGGQEPLVQPSVEFADDQDHVSAIEVQPDAPRERMLEEKILAKQAKAGQEQDGHSRVPAHAAGGSGQAGTSTVGQSQRALQ